jgi:hypothetical protein
VIDLLRRMYRLVRALDDLLVGRWEDHKAKVVQTLLWLVAIDVGECGVLGVFISWKRFNFVFVCSTGGTK